VTLMGGGRGEVALNPEMCPESGTVHLVLSTKRNVYFKDLPTNSVGTPSEIVPNNLDNLFTE
jgi:hypothetical protein